MGSGSHRAVVTFRGRALATLALSILVRSLAAQSSTTAHFHHVHLNVTNPWATIAFYQKFFGANTVKYRGLSDALFTEKSFILLSKVAAPPPSKVGPRSGTSAGLA